MTNECILIKILDGDKHRFNKAIVKNYDLFEDEKTLEHLMAKEIFIIELGARKVYFKNRNIISIKVVRDLKAV